MEALIMEAEWQRPEDALIWAGPGQGSDGRLRPCQGI